MESAVFAHLTDLTPSTCWTRGHDIISKTNRGILPFTLRLGSLVQICLTIALSGQDCISLARIALNPVPMFCLLLYIHEHHLVEGRIYLVPFDLCNALRGQMILHVTELPFHKWNRSKPLAFFPAMRASYFKPTAVTSLFLRQKLSAQAQLIQNEKIWLSD